MTKAPILKLPDFTSCALIQRDAFGTDMGAMLTQNGITIAFF